MSDPTLDAVDGGKGQGRPSRCGITMDEEFQRQGTAVEEARMSAGAGGGKH